MTTKNFEVIIIGAGISGCALAYTLARYTDIKSIAVIEKYEDESTLNSKGTSNSQTIMLEILKPITLLKKLRLQKEQQK